MICELVLGRRVKKMDFITSSNTRRYYNNYNWSVGDGCEYEKK